MSNSDKQTLIDRYLIAYNSFDIGGMLALLSPDVRFENYSGGQLTAADVPPILSSGTIWSPIPNEKEIGREEAIYGRADHRLPA